MAITSSSTLSDVLDQYNNNLIWEDSTTTATNALEAIRWLMINRAKIQETTEHKLDFEAMQVQADQIKAYLDVRRSTTRSSFVAGKAKYPW